MGRLLYHIGTSAVMDLLLRLITCIESPEIRRAVIEVSMLKLLTNIYLVNKLRGHV